MEIFPISARESSHFKHCWFGGSILCPKDKARPKLVEWKIYILLYLNIIGLNYKRAWQKVENKAKLPR